MDPVRTLAENRDILLVALLAVIYAMWRWHDRALHDVEEWFAAHPGHKTDFTRWIGQRNRDRASEKRRAEQEYQDRIWGPCFCIGDPALGPDGRCTSCHRIRRRH